MQEKRQYGAPLMYSLCKAQRLVGSIQMDNKRQHTQMRADSIFQGMHQISQQRKHLVKWLLPLKKVQ